MMTRLKVPTAAFRSVLLLLAAAVLAACDATPTDVDAAPRFSPAVSPSLVSIDPALLTPNPVENSSEGTVWECRRTGTGAKCAGHWQEIEEAFDIAACGAQTLYVVTGVLSRDQVREFNRDLLEISRDVHLGVKDEILSLSSTGDGPTLVTFQNILQLITFGVPGDLATRTRTESGVYLQVREPGGRVVFQDAGQLSYSDSDELLATHGRFDDPMGTAEVFIEQICSALLGQ